MVSWEMCLQSIISNLFVRTQIFQMGFNLIFSSDSDLITSIVHLSVHASVIKTQTPTFFIDFPCELTLAKLIATFKTFHLV